MTNRITDTLDAACLIIVQRALDKRISYKEAEKLVRRAETLTVKERLKNVGIVIPRKLPRWMKR